MSSFWYYKSTPTFERRIILKSANLSFIPQAKRKNSTDEIFITLVLASWKATKNQRNLTFSFRKLNILNAIHISQTLHRRINKSESFSVYLLRNEERKTKTAFYNVDSRFCTFRNGKIELYIRVFDRLGQKIEFEIGKFVPESCEAPIECPLWDYGLILDESYPMASQDLRSRLILNDNISLIIIFKFLP